MQFYLRFDVKDSPMNRPLLLSSMLSRFARKQYATQQVISGISFWQLRQLEDTSTSTTKSIEITLSIHIIKISLHRYFRFCLYVKVFARRDNITQLLSAFNFHHLLGVNNFIAVQNSIASVFPFSN